MDEMLKKTQVTVDLYTLNRLIEKARSEEMYQKWYTDDERKIDILNTENHDLTLMVDELKKQNAELQHHLSPKTEG